MLACWVLGTVALCASIDAGNTVLLVLYITIWAQKLAIDPLYDRNLPFDIKLEELDAKYIIHSGNNFVPIE